jgi:hypothetical protein
VEGLRSFGVKQFCLVCRTELHPGAEKQFKEILRPYVVIERQVKRSEVSWGSLAVKEQGHVSEVL